MCVEGFLGFVYGQCKGTRAPKNQPLNSAPLRKAQAKHVFLGHPYRRNHKPKQEEKQQWSQDSQSKPYPARTRLGSYSEDHGT